ncbi:hypothetical protein [Streptomyces sp. NBC_00576]|uniref:hypothetical protein n=1 Tax=Streptomyces sp. NBC_00576 TaxID=2903665 RepID=UPI002E81E3CC|nr:hypothetical protein [Streptomyces sp. NBC_00576]WUB72525.1 hypothetical protein OG734_21745 [Streptomyces sp. NBC_00576]
MKFDRKRLVYGVGMGAAVTATLLFGAGPAAAYGDLTARSVASGKYAYMAGTIDFYAEGDRFEVCDNSSDGAGVAGYWKIGSGGDTTKIYNGNGAGALECVWRNKNPAETAVVYIKVCLQDNGNVLDDTCSTWRSIRANGSNP